VTDRHRDLIARAYLRRVGGDVAESPAHGGYSPLLAACLEQCFVSGVEREGEWKQWLCRWAHDAVPGPSDLPLLRRLAVCEEWHANHVAAVGLGRLGSEKSLVELSTLAARLREQDDTRWWLALAMLARRGDGEALAALEGKAREEGFALAFLIDANEVRGREVLYELLCSGDDDLLDVALSALSRQELAHFGAIVDDAQLVGVRELVESSVQDGFALARIIAAIAACRTVELARRAAGHAALRSPPYLVDHGFPGGGLPGFLAFLEVADIEALAQLLRAWAASEDEELRDHGHRSLLALGRPADAELLVAWIRAGGGDRF